MARISNKYAQDLKPQDVIIYDGKVCTVKKVVDKNNRVTISMVPAMLKSTLTVEVYPLSSHECLILG